jgi:hypothetical protein
MMDLQKENSEGEIPGKLASHYLTDRERLEIKFPDKHKGKLRLDVVKDLGLQSMLRQIYARWGIDEEDAGARHPLFLAKVFGVGSTWVTLTDDESYFEVIKIYDTAIKKWKNAKNKGDPPFVDFKFTKGSEKVRVMQFVLRSVSLPSADLRQAKEGNSSRCRSRTQITRSPREKLCHCCPKNHKD